MEWVEEQWKKKFFHVKPKISFIYEFTILIVKTNDLQNCVR